MKFVSEGFQPFRARTVQTDRQTDKEIDATKRIATAAAVGGKFTIK